MAREPDDNANANEGIHMRVFKEMLKKIPRQSRSRSVVESVLVAATQELERTGNEKALTLTQICERAGISMGSLYDYFNDRDTVLAGVVAATMEESLREFKGVLETTAPMSLRDSVELVVKRAFERFVANLEFLRALMRIAQQIGMLAPITQSVRGFTSALTDAFAKRSDIGASDLPATSYLLAHTFIGLVHALVWDDEPPVSVDRLEKQMIELAYAHLRGVPVT